LIHAGDKADRFFAIVHGSLNLYPPERPAEQPVSEGEFLTQQHKRFYALRRIARSQCFAHGCRAPARNLPFCSRCLSSCGKARVSNQEHVEGKARVACSGSRVACSGSERKRGQGSCPSEQNCQRGERKEEVG
jgi:hypothetical protein